MTDSSLPADIPLGPFEGTQINAHAAKGKTARLHAKRSCSALRTNDVRSLTLPLNAETIGRMCRECAAWGRWARQRTALGVFLEAVRGTGLCYQLDIYSSPDEDDCSEDEVARAALLLREHDYPPEDDEDEDEDEDLWSDFEDARATREAVFQQWASAAESLHRALTAIARYPWLEPWARPRLTQKSEYVEASRRMAARFCRPDALTAAAVVFQTPDPELPVEDPVFSVLGDATAVESRLNRFWQRWKENVASDWHAPDRQSSPIYDLEQGIERKRKKRDAVLARGRELVAEWAAQAQSKADTLTGPSEQSVLARVPMSETHEGRHSANFEESVSHWELAVLATYTVEADWGRRTMLLRVPATIGDRLLAGGSALDCEPGDGGPSAASGPQQTDEPLTPGILDDTPVAERRPITAAHLRALRTADDTFGEQLAIVLSAEKGVEVLPTSVIEKRCATGWRGVLVAAASDLPASLIDPWIQGFPVDTEADSKRLWANQHLPPSDPDFARHLGTAAGEAWIQTMLSAPYYSPVERDRALRCLALARSVHDLRTLDDAFDYRHRTVPVATWHALIAADVLDLRPFQREDETEFRGGGIGAPLGVLANVQIYTTNANPAAMGKGHSPYCSHVKDMAVTRYHDLLTVADLLRMNDANWCSKCGGYAPRTLTEPQLDYYRSAHRLHSVAQGLRTGMSWPNDQEMATLRAELDLLREWRPADDTDWQGGPAWRWNDIVQQLSARAQQVTSTLTDPSAGGKVIRLRQEDE